MKTSSLLVASGLVLFSTLLMKASTAEVTPLASIGHTSAGSSSRADHCGGEPCDAVARGTARAARKDGGGSPALVLTPWLNRLVEWRSQCYCDRMTLKARVKAGRLVVDEPTDLPEGTEIELLPLDPGDWLDEDDRAVSIAL